MNLLNVFNDAIYWIPALLVAITFHEYAHGKVADMLGDPTPRAYGRLTLNPVSHIDPIGLIMLILVRFGWAKPVPVNPLHFRGDRRRGMLMVAVAGPATNFALAIVAGAGFRAVLLGLFGQLTIPMAKFFAWLLLYNIFLGLFNLIPVPPLDGSKILTSILPRRYEYHMHQLGQYGFLFLIILLFTGAHRLFLIPAANFLMVSIASIFGFEPWLLWAFL